MLTDYHVHLRPDGPDSGPEKYFTSENAQRYRHGLKKIG
jgi:histidinol-phosphatase (PHP family)